MRPMSTAGDPNQPDRHNDPTPLAVVNGQQPQADWRPASNTTGGSRDCSRCRPMPPRFSSHRIRRRTHIDQGHARDTTGSADDSLSLSGPPLKRQPTPGDGCQPELPLSLHDYTLDRVDECACLVDHVGHSRRGSRCWAISGQLQRDGRRTAARRAARLHPLASPGTTSRRRSHGGRGRKTLTRAPHLAEPAYLVAARGAGSHVLGLVLAVGTAAAARSGTWSPARAGSRAL